MTIKDVFVAVLLLTMPISASAKETVLYFEYNSGSFSATGNWIAADPKIKPPFPSETEIDCIKNTMICVEATAEVYGSHPHVSLNILRVIRWDKDGIIARDSSGICMTVTMQIIFAEKRISSTHSMKQLEDEKKQACNFFGTDKTQEDIFVLKGSERWNKEHSLLPDKSGK